MGRNDRKRVHAQVSARRRTRGRDLGLGRPDGPEYLAHAIEIDLSLGGQRQPPRGPIDEPHAEALLQSRDELCHGRWRQAYVLGCPRKAAALRHALENGHLGRRTGHTGNSFMSDGNSLPIIPAV